MNLTRLIRPYFTRIDSRMVSAAADTESSQRRLLHDLTTFAAKTEWGREHGYADIRSYADYVARVPLNEYEDLRPRVMRMVNGEKDILWPGEVKRFAQSSGTSGGKSKYIPLTDRSLQRCHYAGSTDVVAHYLSLYPDSRILNGKAFILGGSYANEVNPRPGVYVGDLSASLIDKINPLANLVRVPSKEIALMADWEKKLPRLVEATLRADVTNLSGVPSWFMTVIRRVMEAAGVSELHQVWPNLEVFFHGGISFEPYRSQYDSLIDPSRMRYLETYNASEGFFALQDSPDSRAMLLLMDVDTFYEFIPLSELSNQHPKAVPAWEVELGRVYALVISSSNGLWRYMLGDTVRIESRSPLRITIAGRTKSFINAFGEEVMVHNTDAALARACRDTNAEVAEYTAAPVYAADGSKGRHQWVIAFNQPPADIEQFADLLDLYLTQENSDYQAKRAGNIFLDRLTIDVVSRETFERWLASTGKLGGQRKIPRLSNDRTLVTALLQPHP